jgi:signal transduction histidine kinase
MADADRLRQVITSLVVTAAEMSREGVITLRATQAGDLVQFDVNAPAIWDTAKNNSGVSLALSQRLVELHGGHLRVEQHAGATVFEFALPVNVNVKTSGF